MKKSIVLFLILIGCFLIDNIIMPFFSIGGYYGSLLLTFSICYSIVNGKWEGLWIGVFGGLLQDVYFYNCIGLNALTNMIICLIAGAIGVTIFKEKRLVPIFLVLVLSLLKGTVIFGGLMVFSIKVNLFNVLFSAVYNAIISVFLYKKVYNLCQKSYMQVQWKF